MNAKETVNKNKTTLLVITLLLTLLSPLYAQYFNVQNLDQRFIDNLDKMRELEEMLSATWNPTFYNLQQPFTYVISKVGSYTVIQNGTTGALQYKNLNSSIAINFAYGNMTSGGTLAIRSGNYAVNNLNPANNTRTIGEGTSTKLILPNGFTATSNDDCTNVFFISAKTNVEIAWLEIDGNQSAYARYGPTGTTNAFCGIKSDDSTYVKVHHLYVHDIRRSGVLFWGTYHEYTPIWCEASDSILIDCNWDAIEFSDCSEATMRNCFITGTSDVALGAWECQRIKISGITAWNGNRDLGDVNGHNIMSFDGNANLSAPTSQISVTDCTFSGFTGEGMLFLAGTFQSEVSGCMFYNMSNRAIVEYSNTKLCHENTIAKNTFLFCSWNSSSSVIDLQCASYLGAWKIIDNMFDNTGQASGNYTCAIRIDRGTNHLIMGNHIKNIRTKGISIDDVFNTTVAYNEIWDNQTSKSMIAGILELTPADYNLIEHNTIINITTPITPIGANTIIRWNQGYKTEHSGNATIAGNASAIAVAHGLVLSPSFVHITSTNASDTIMIAVTSKNATYIVITQSSGTGYGVIYYYAQTWNYP